MAPELEALPPDESDGDVPRDADNHDDLERAQHEVGQTRLIEREVRSYLRSYEGPLPSPEAFASYEQTAPGAANRILQLAEDEAQHRRSEDQADGEHIRMLQDFEAKQDAKRQNQGLISGGIMGTVITVAAIVIALLGDTIAATVIITSTVGSVTGIYVLGSRWQRQDQAPPSIDDEEHTD